VISDALTARGWLVVQIGPDASTAEHELTPFAVVQDGILMYRPSSSLAGFELTRRK
jgi:hypothetical protein